MTAPAPDAGGGAAGEPTAGEPTVFIVDDEESVRQSLRWLLESIRLRVETFASAEDFLARFDQSRPGCIVLDVRMPGMSGPELMDRLNQAHAATPIIFLSAHGDVPLAVRSMKGGAVDFLQKPYNNQQFLERVQQALAQDARERERRRKQSLLAASMNALTPREREILEKVVAGLSNKQIGKALAISHKTVEAHRARLMRKMGASSFAELLQLVLTGQS
ncbi:MAG: response regulator transcription factor [Nevskia sp.]|nr:response regulator transcription factor [Nevskia sp.]